MHKPAVLFAIAALAAVIALVVLPLGPETGTVAGVLWLIQMIVIAIGLVALVRGWMLWRREHGR